MKTRKNFAPKKKFIFMGKKALLVQNIIEEPWWSLCKLKNVASKTEERFKIHWRSFDQNFPNSIYASLLGF